MGGTGGGGVEVGLVLAFLWVRAGLYVKDRMGFFCRLVTVGLGGFSEGGFVGEYDQVCCGVGLTKKRGDRSLL